MSKYVAFLDILGFKEKLKKLKQQDAKSFIGRFSTTAFEQWENMSPTLVEGYIVSDSFILYTRDTSTQAVSQLLTLVEKICQQEFIPTAIKIIKDSGSNGSLLVRKARCDLDDAFEKIHLLFHQRRKKLSAKN